MTLPHAKQSIVHLDLISQQLQTLMRIARDGEEPDPDFHERLCSHYRRVRNDVARLVTRFDLVDWYADHGVAVPPLVAGRQVKR